MSKPCSICGRTKDLYLWYGRIYCLWCFPLAEADLPIRVRMLLRRCQADREHSKALCRR